MFNETEHEILTIHKTEIVKNIDFFPALTHVNVVFILLINVKMPTIVGILTFISRIIFMLSWRAHEKKFYNLEGWT